MCLGRELRPCLPGKLLKTGSGQNSSRGQAWIEVYFKVESDSDTNLEAAEVRL